MNRFIIIIIIILLCSIGAVRANAQTTVTTPGVTAGQCLQSDSSSDVVDAGCPSRTYVLPISGSRALSNAECGAYITSGGGSSTPAVTLPASPLNSCTFTFDTATTRFYVKTSPLGSNLVPARLLGYGEALYQFTLQNTGVDFSFYTIQYDGQEWKTAEFSIHEHDLFSVNDATQVTNGQVYFQWDSAQSRFELLQRN